MLLYMPSLVFFPLVKSSHLQEIHVKNLWLHHFRQLRVLTLSKLYWTAGVRGRLFEALWHCAELEDLVIA